MKFLRTVYIALLVFALPMVAGAQGFGTGTGSNNPGYGSGNCDPFIGFCNPLKVSTICQALQLFLDALLTLAVPVAVLFLVYAGFKFVWARGNKTGLIDARRNLMYTLIGIGIFMGAWVLGQILANTLNTLGTAAGQPNQPIGQCK